VRCWLARYQGALRGQKNDSNINDLDIFQCIIRRIQEASLARDNHSAFIAVSAKPAK
jgi:hypothetical protein